MEYKFIFHWKKNGITKLTVSFKIKEMKYERKINKKKFASTIGGKEEYFENQNIPTIALLSFSLKNMNLKTDEPEFCTISDTFWASDLGKGI